MKKLLTLTLSLLMAFSLCLTISAEGETVVAKIDDTEYTSLQDAINKASSGQTIVLQDDITVDTLTISGEKTITLNMNGKTITQDYSNYKDENAYRRLIDVSDGANLTITGNGKFVGPDGEDGAEFDARPLVVVDGNNTKLTILNGTFTAGGSGSDGVYGVYSLNSGTIILGDENTKTGKSSAFKVSA